MSVAGKPLLYHNDMAVCAAKVRMALAEKGIEWEGIHLNLRAGDAQKPDYVKLNPNRVVPTLVHMGVPVIESNIICEYIDDRWTNNPLRPKDALERASMRLWMKRLDDEMHVATGIVSTCVAWRFQYLGLKPEAYRDYLDNIPDPARRRRTEELVQAGMESPYFAKAVKGFERLVDDFDRALGRGPWLAGQEYSLADLVYAPYMTRLQHLGLDDMVTRRPLVVDWVRRLFARPSYKEGIVRWINPNYVEIYDRERETARAKAREIVAHAM